MWFINSPTKLKRSDGPSVGASAKLRRSGRGVTARNPRELLAACLNNYLKLAPGEESEFDRLWAEQSTEVTQVVNSFETQGRLKGQREMLRDLLEARFGPLPPEVALKVAVLPHERLKEVSIAILTAQSLKELSLTDE